MAAGGGFGHGLSSRNPTLDDNQNRKVVLVVNGQALRLADDSDLLGFVIGYGLCVCFNFSDSLFHFVSFLRV